MQVARSQLRLTLPYNWLPPDGWRTRFSVIEADLDAEGPLAQQLRKVRRTSHELGDLAAQQAVNAVVELHPDLLPGQAGLEVAWSIVCDAAIHPFRRADRDMGAALHESGGSSGVRDIFEEPVSTYQDASPRAGRKNRFQARRLRKPDQVRELLALLSGSDQRPPQTHIRIKERLGLTSTQLQKRIYRLHQLGVRLRSSEQQKLLDRIFHAGTRSILDLNQDVVEMSAAEAEYRTGHPIDVLVDHYHCEQFTQSRIGSDERTELVRVPRHLLLFDTQGQHKPSEAG